jgi:putative DNA primase/helicase
MSGKGQDFNDMLANADPDQVADLVDFGDNLGDLADFNDAPPPPTPHPAFGGSPEWADDEEGIPPDDQAPADADRLPVEVIVANSLQPQNDVGNGMRLLAWYRDELLFVRADGWHTWLGTHWEREGGDECARLRAQTTAARIVLEADHMAATPNEQRVIDAGEDAKSALAALDRVKVSDRADDHDKKRRDLVGVIDQANTALAAVKARQISRRKYAVSSANSGKLNNMLTEAQPHRSAKVDQLDSEKLAFNVQNGTLRFVCEEVPDPDASDHSPAMVKTWRVVLHPHNPADFVSKLAPVDYDPKATAPRFTESITTFSPVEEVRKFLQRYHGYALTGLTGEQCLVFNYGLGSNWKSTFVEIVSRVMGTYCKTINFESIAGDQQRSGSQASPDIARLLGARLVRASEPERGVQFKEALIKSLTGGEPMLTRHNFGAFFEFRPDFKLVLSGNHKPEIGGVDHGIWRRMRFVLWPVQIEEGKKRQMDEVLAELWEERSGILNWLIEGALDYLNRGLRTPQEVIDATAEYREEMDPVGSFLADCLTSDETSEVPARAMFDAWDSWAYANGVKAWKEKAFATTMSAKGFKKERRAGGRVYLNVRLHDVPSARRPRAEPPPPVDDEVPL